MAHWLTREPEWRAVLLNDPCVYCCGRPRGLDHITPRAAGGKDHWENRAPACAECDGAKAHIPLLRFLNGERYTIHFPGRGPRRLREELPPPKPLTFTIGELAESKKAA